MISTALPFSFAVLFPHSFLLPFFHYNPGADNEDIVLVFSVVVRGKDPFHKVANSFGCSVGLLAKLSLALTMRCTTTVSRFAILHHESKHRRHYHSKREKRQREIDQ